jgi:PAS domain S-box-containing protein
MLERTNKVARVGGWELDLRRQILYWTSVTKEIHGMPADYEPSLTGALEFYKPGESREMITEAINNAISKGTPWNLDLQITDARGKEIWVRALGNAVLEDGVCKRLYGTFQDIDDHKRAEMALMQRCYHPKKAEYEELKVQVSAGAKAG